MVVLHCCPKTGRDITSVGGDLVTRTLRAEYEDERLDPGKKDRRLDFRIKKYKYNRGKI